MILKIDYIIPGLYIPIVEYKFFHPNTKEPLDLNACIKSPISFSYPTLKDIDNNTFMHEPNNEYYNNKCFPYTTDNGTEMTEKLNIIIIIMVYVKIIVNLLELIMKIKNRIVNAK